MTGLYRPSASFVERRGHMLWKRLTFLFDPRFIISVSGHARCGSSGISLVCTKPVQGFSFGLGPRDYQSIQDRSDLAGIMPVGAGYDEGQRDSMDVYQQMTFGSFFFPDPSGWAPQSVAPSAPLRCPHRCSANTRQFLPDHRIRPSRRARWPRTRRPSASVESRHAPNSGSRIAPWATLSIGTPCEAHRQCPQTRVAAAPRFAAE